MPSNIYYISFVFPSIYKHKIITTQYNGADVESHLTSLIIKKKKAGDFKCAMPPDFVIPQGHNTLYRCLLTTLAQDKPYHEKPLIRDCCKHNGSCTLFRPYLTITARIEFCMSFCKTISSEFLVQGNFKHTQFSQKHWY